MFYYSKLFYARCFFFLLFPTYDRMLFKIILTNKIECKSIKMKKKIARHICRVNIFLKFYNLYRVMWVYISLLWSSFLLGYFFAINIMLRWSIGLIVIKKKTPLAIVGWQSQRDEIFIEKILYPIQKPQRGDMSLLWSFFLLQ